jgi:flagellar basal-body rod protein FlgC
MSLFNSLSVSASGMTAERQRAEVLVENIANADTTRTASGGPYKRQDVIFQSQDVTSPFSSIFDSQMSSQGAGVGISQIVTDQSAGDRRYMPGHPDADKDGYVTFPKVNPAEDMVDLLGASRSYQANVSAISAVKDMIQRSIDLFK